MHGVHENESFLDPTLVKASFHLRGDVYKSASGGDVEPEFFAVGFHDHLFL
jgi:hypothetical protein